MTDLNDAQTLDFVETLARSAGEKLRQWFNNPHDTGRKSSQVDLVTEADRATEQFITDELRAAYPNFSLLGEEGGMYNTGTGSPFRWVIDPIDGTTNYAHAIPYFCINITLLDGEHFPPRLAVCYDPMHDEMFKGIRGEGAWLNDNPLRVTSTPHLAEAVVASGFPYTKRTDPDNNADQWAHFVTRARGLRRMGAAGLDVAWVAAGRFDGYWEHNINLWDIAPGILFVLEAGGTISDYAGEPLPFGPGPLRMVASNGHIHAEIVRVLQAGDAAPRPSA